MKILSLCLLLFINYSYAICENGFDRPIDWQFKETLGRYFTNHETYVQRNVDSIVKTFAEENRTRKEVLQQLIDTGYLTIENSPDQNRLFRDILNRPPEAVIKEIRENPDSLYEGTLLNLPPFFLIVFVGEREAMQASIEVDRALVNSRNPLQEVPIHYTIDPDIAGDLLRNNAKPNEPDKKGRVGLHNMRNPETVRVMLYYKANPMVRDRSGVPLIKFHREQVGDKEIVDLLEQTRESRKSVNGTRNNKEPAVNQKTEEEIRVKETKRVEEARRVEAVRRAERARRAEEVREARRAVREEARRQIREEDLKMVEKQKNQLIPEMAEEIADAIMKKVMVFGLIRSLISGNFQYPVSYIQNIKTQASNIIVFQKEIADKFEKRISVAMVNLITNPAQTKVAVDKIEQAVQEIENELVVILKEDISHLTLAAMKRQLKKAQRQSSKFDKMVTQLLPYKNFREGFVRDLMQKFDRHQIPRPASISGFLTGTLLDITFPE